MKIAFDITPISDNNSLHAVRGAGFYIRHLKDALIKEKGSDKIEFFAQGEKIPSVDAIHFPYFEPFFFTLPFKKRAKTVVTVHDLTPLVLLKLFPVGIKGMVKWQVQKRVLKNMDAIITDSECSKRDIIRLAAIPQEKVHVVYLAAAEMFQRIKMQDARVKEMRKKYNLPEKFVLYVGDITPNKNVPRVIDATKKVRIPLVLVGRALSNHSFDQTNPWNKDLVFVRENAYADNLFTFLGFVPDVDLIMLYNMASAFVFPSLYEGFGLPVLEAMQSGCPVITSKGGSLAEIVGDAAEFVDPTNIDSIANGINDVFTNPKLQKELSEKGLKQAKKFSWRKTAQQTLEVYHSLL